MQTVPEYDAVMGKLPDPPEYKLAVVEAPGGRVIVKIVFKDGASALHTVKPISLQEYTNAK